MKVADTYSKALFLMGPKYLEPLQALLKIPGLIPFLASPVIPKEEKLSIFDEELLPFFSFLLDHGRAADLDHIVEEYRKRIQESKGILEAELFSAAPVDSTEIRKKLEKEYNKKIVIHEKRDPSLISGAIVQIGNRRMDYSLNGRLEKLRKELCK